MVYAAEQSKPDCELHEQIYSWEPEADVWGSLTDRDETLKLRTALVEAFDPSKRVTERSILQLEEALAVLRSVLLVPAASGWSDCSETAGDSPSEQINLRANTALLLYRHLEWVVGVFRHVPGASVTVR